MLSSQRLPSEVAQPKAMIQDYLSHQDFVKQTEDLIQKYAFSKESADTAKRIEHICTTPPKVLSEVFGGGSSEQKYKGGESFQAHGNRLRCCYFASSQGHLYMGVKFNINAEGPPACAHGGSIATVIDIALALIAAHNSDSVCLTKDLKVVYEKSIPLKRVVLIRSWLSVKDGKRIVAECDILSDTGDLHARGSATLINFPASRSEVGGLLSLSTEIVESTLVPIKLKREAEEDQARVSGVQLSNLPRQRFPEDTPLLKKFNGWEEMSPFIEFPDIILPETRTYYGLHIGKHFEMTPEGGSLFYKMFRSPSGDVEGIVYFSKYSEGPPLYVHGGAIATLMDAFLADYAFLTVGWGLVTRMLNIKYIRSIPVESIAYLGKIEVISRTHRSIIVKGSIVDENGKVFCLAMADFASMFKQGFYPFEWIRDVFGRTSGLNRDENRKAFLQMMPTMHSPVKL